MTDSDAAASITVDHGSRHSHRHSKPLFVHCHNLYEQGLFTDCHLVTKEKTIACHRAVLSAYSPVLHNMLTSAMTESLTNDIPVHDFSADTMERILKYMYTGVLHVPKDDLQAIIKASHFYQMTALTNSLGEEARHTVEPTNAVSWRAIAVAYDLPPLTDCCDRVLILGFSQVVQHAEFLEISEDEVIEYFQMCRPHANNIGHDVMLRAAVLWLFKNKERVTKCKELLCCIKLEACTKKSLEDAVRHYDFPQFSLQLITSVADSPPRQQRTMAYLTFWPCACLVLDNAGQFRTLANVATPDNKMCSLKYVAMENGFLLVLRDKQPDLNSMVSCTIISYEAPRFERITVCDDGHLVSSSNTLHVMHRNRLYLFPQNTKQKYYEYYDFGLHSWNKFPFPSRRRWQVKAATSHGDDLYIITRCLRLFKLKDDILTEIPIDLCTAGDIVSVEMTAVHVWLYVHITTCDEITGEGSMVTHCYNTAVGVWTKPSTKIEMEARYIMKTYLYDNKICIESGGERDLEYDLLSNVMVYSKRPTGMMRPFLINVDSQHLDPESSLPLYVKDW